MLDLGVGPFVRPDPPRSFPKRLAHCDGAQRDAQHTSSAWQLAALGICAVLRCG